MQKSRGEAAAVKAKTDDVLLGVARTIGTTLGAIVAKVTPSPKPAPARKRRRTPKKKATAAIATPRRKRAKSRS